MRQKSKMAKFKKNGGKKAGVPPEELYEAVDYQLVPDEEKHAGQRYDVSIIHSLMILKLCAYLCSMCQSYFSMKRIRRRVTCI